MDKINCSFVREEGSVSCLSGVEAGPYFLVYSGSKWKLTNSHEKVFLELETEGSNSNVKNFPYDIDHIIWFVRFYLFNYVKFRN